MYTLLAGAADLQRRVSLAENDKISLVGLLSASDLSRPAPRRQGCMKHAMFLRSVNFSRKWFFELQKLTVVVKTRLTTNF